MCSNLTQVTLFLRKLALRKPLRTEVSLRMRNGKTLRMRIRIQKSLRIRIVCVCVCVYACHQ